MSEEVLSAFKSGERGEEEQSSQPVEPVVAQQPSEEQPQQEEPPTETQDIAAGQEREDVGAPEVQDEEPDIEADLLEFSEAKTGGKRGDGPDVKGEILSNLEPVQVPEAGEGQPQV
ncbi:PREDICTED: P antigen family member 3-like [Propithecus coquereli]|uniref:P antigen family member 3-like n=1 Tax=Propithecus coquereli TaxID=379532 RepID=UPI00063EFA19|nr:PREDICTED: P antigen family member 3-like [Propithecus coquereli]